MNSITLKEKAVRRFWSFIDKKGEDECWTWKGAKLTNGYGAFSVGIKRISAHRFSWNLHFGEIPKGMVVCHKCDNPPCANPNHLFIGTDAENQRDKKEKGRAARGEANNKAKLTEDDVREIRLMINQGLSSRVIASKFNVRHAAILTIKNGKNWSWLK